MLVTQSNFGQFLHEFNYKVHHCAVSRCGRFIVGLDTETIGIWHWQTPNVPWYKPRVFSVQFALSEKREDCYYLDFNHSADKLTQEHFDILGRIIFARADILWAIQNAKFELHQLKNHAIDIIGKIHCTKAIARVTNSLEEKLSLDDLGAKYFQTPKIDVKTYIEEHKLYTLVYRYGRENEEGYDPEKWLHFDRLPLDMLVDYGVLDTVLCLKLCIYQLKELERMQNEFYVGSTASIWAVYENECELAKTFFEMERVGVQLDIPYCKEAYAFEVSEYKRIGRELDEVAAKHFQDREINWNSADDLKDFFGALGEKSYKVTKKGAMSWDAQALEQMESPHAKAIIKYRYHYKRAHTYFENFIWLADVNGVIHPDFQQGGTVTGRVSCWNPNLQNVPKRKDKGETNYKIRRAFIPRPGFFFADKDYNAAEYRLMFDYAREMQVIERVIAGEDVHDVTKEELSLPNRDVAKTSNFALLYGQGDKSFAASLKKTLDEAKKLKETYFAKFPNVVQFIANVRQASRRRGYVFNFMGRLTYVVNRGGFDKETWFKSPNSLIQGGVGDLTKLACNRTHAHVKPYKSRLILQVHDALLFEIANDETHLIPELISIMEKCYPHKVLPMKAEAEFSRESWASLQDAF